MCPDPLQQLAELTTHIHVHSTVEYYYSVCSCVDSDMHMDDM